jgi:hypothetical protein
MPATPRLLMSTSQVHEVRVEWKEADERGPRIEWLSVGDDFVRPHKRTEAPCLPGELVEVETTARRWMLGAVEAVHPWGYDVRPRDAEATAAEEEEEEENVAVKAKEENETEKAEDGDCDGDGGADAEVEEAGDGAGAEDKGENEDDDEEDEKSSSDNLVRGVLCTV